MMQRPTNYQRCWQIGTNGLETVHNRQRIGIQSKELDI
jgi:hypothetical protein